MLYTEMYSACCTKNEKFLLCLCFFTYHGHGAGDFRPPTGGFFTSEVFSMFFLTQQDDLLRKIAESDLIGILFMEDNNNVRMKNASYAGLLSFSFFCE
jgi:hypothetical protein